MEFVLKGWENQRKMIIKSTVDHQIVVYECLWFMIIYNAVSAIFHDTMNPPLHQIFRHMGVSWNRGTQNGWFLSWKIQWKWLKMDDLGGALMLGNLQLWLKNMVKLCWAVSFQWWWWLNMVQHRIISFIAQEIHWHPGESSPSASLAWRSDLFQENEDLNHDKPW